MDIEKAKKEFINYTKNYDLSDSNIKRKQKHSIRVMENSNKIAKSLNLNEKDKYIATLIGLLHDIGRFEQYKQYKTYKDINSIDHGDLGAQILENELKKHLSEDEIEYNEIIIKAVKNHNKYEIEKGLNEKEKLFANIIRDADKLDILDESIKIFWKGNEKEVEKCEISDEKFSYFINKQSIKSKKQEEPIDSVLKIIAFIFDINYKYSFKIIKEKNYINKIIDRYNFKENKTKEKMEEIRKIANEYINEKANGEI